MTSAADRIGQIRAILRGDVSDAQGRLLRKELHQIALVHYVPKHSNDEYMNWISKHLPSFHDCGSQSKSEPWVLSMFTVVSQRVYGDCVQECLDEAIDGPVVLNFVWEFMRPNKR